MRIVLFFQFCFMVLDPIFVNYIIQIFFLKLRSTFSVVCIIEGTRPKISNKRTKFLNLLVFVHLKNYFIEVLNKFLMCFEINGLKNLKLTILRFFAWSPQLYILLYSSKNIFIVKIALIHIIFILMF